MAPATEDEPRRLPAGGISILFAAGAGVLMLLFLGLGRQAPMAPAIGGAAGVAVLGVALFVRRLLSSRSAGAVSPAPATPIPLAPDPPFAAMLDGLPEPVLLVSGGQAGDLAAQRFLFANAAARAVLPILRDQAPLATAIRAPGVLRVVDSALFGERGGEASFQLGGSQLRHWRARAARLGSSADGHPPLAVLTLRDETDALSNARLRADFLANASHELRTPLASLAGFIETLSGHAREDTAARERFLPIMQAQADRMRRLIENLMSLSSIEQSEHVPPSGEVDLALAAIDVLDALEPQARIREVRFERNLPGLGEAVVVGDRDQIVQVVQNLADNALKYSPNGGSVSIELESVSDLSTEFRSTRAEAPSHSLLVPAGGGGGRYLAVRVRDAGPGIARTNLPRLTERFYRVEGQKSGEHSGTGLGLAIVKHIVNRHGGALFVESLEGGGSTFTACFPAVEKAQ
jgi:two-component system phosphate regulon sensor histidine kinase PhoR